MTTLSEIKRDPASFLGTTGGDDSDDYDLFIDAVETLLTDHPELSESEAIDRVWHNGDWVPAATAIVAGNNYSFVI